jgi:transposase
LRPAGCQGGSNSSGLNYSGTATVLRGYGEWRFLSLEAKASACCRFPPSATVAAITRWNFYFRLYPSAIRSLHVIDFLRHLLRHLTGKLLVGWDGLSAHRAGVVGDFIRAQRGRLVIEQLPGYAPELNPAEYIWGYRMHHELPNFCPRDFAQLGQQACRSSVRSGAGQGCHYNMQDSNNDEI